MIPIQHHTYNLDKQYHAVYDRLVLSIEETDQPFHPITGRTLDTARDWVGHADRLKGTFKIAEPNPSIFPFRWLSGNFFTLVITGKIQAHANSTLIDVRYTLGLITIIYFAMAYVLPLFSISECVLEGQCDQLTSAIFLLAIFAIIPTVLLILQLRRTANKIDTMLGAS